MNLTTDSKLDFAFDLSHCKPKLLSSQHVHPIMDHHITCQLPIEPSQQPDMAIL